MYEGSIAISAGTGVATLQLTGLSLGWQIVLAVTVIVAALALLRLSPRIRRRRA